MAAGYASYLQGQQHLFQGLQRMGELNEARKEKEKQEGRLFKALQEELDIVWGIPKESTLTKDLGTLAGMVRGYHAKAEKDDADLRRKIDFAKLAEIDQQDKFNRAFAEGAPPVMGYDYGPGDLGMEESFSRANPSMQERMMHALSVAPGAVSPNTLMNALAGMENGGMTEYQRESLALRREQLGQTKDDRTAAMKNADEIDRLLRLASEATDPKVRESLLRRARVMEGSKLKITQGPNGELTVTQGVDIGDSTSTTQTRREATVDAGETPIGLISEILASVQWKDVGIPGALGEFKDKFGGMINPDWADKERVRVRQDMKLLTTRLFKSLRSDSNISQTEVKKIEGIINGVNWDSSLPMVQEQLANIKDLIIKESRSASAKLGKKPPVWAMNVKEIAEALKAGEIDEAAALQAIKAYHPETLQQWLTPTQ